jgi:hypothetical protein
MAIEGRRDTIIYKLIVPITGAILGAIAATWFRAASFDAAQLQDIVMLIKDDSLTGAQKTQALEIYKEITDRPWSIVRSLVASFSFAVAALIGLWAARGNPFK